MLLRKSIICLCLAIVLPGLLACSSNPAQSSELTDDEVRALIQNDIQVILDHLDSLAKTNYGKNYLADLLEKDLELSCELVWYENGKEAGKTLGTNREVYRFVAREQVDKALFHRVTIGIKESSSGVYVLGHWLIYPDGRILPSSTALRLEAELVK